NTALARSSRLNVPTAGAIMRIALSVLFISFAALASAAEVESRVLTTYVPQDLLETAVRTEGWTEIPLNVKGGARKGDVVRIWAGGSIDRGNGDQPGENVNGPAGLETPATGVSSLALSPEAGHAFALLFKTEGPALRRCLPPGKPLEIKLDKDK